jgi:hypothetical protein
MIFQTGSEKASSNSLKAAPKDAVGERLEKALKFLASPWLIAFSISFLLYWRILSLPFFWDDVPHFDFATTRTFLQIWTNVSGFPYYRPAVFTFWKIALAVLPTAPTFLLHLANLLVHATNAALIGVITRGLIQADRRPTTPASTNDPTADLAGGFSSLFFAAYPFAVLPVTLVAALFHLALALTSLGAVAAALKFVQTRKQPWLILTLLLSILAPYCHESGAMIAVLVALTMIIANWRTAWNYKWFLGLLLVFSLLFVVVWAIVPKTHDATERVTWESLGASFTWFAQGPTYPLQPLARPLVERGWWDLGAIWLVALPTLIASVSLLVWQKQWRALGFSLGWFGFAMLPSLLVLPYSYIFLSMRLLYYPGLGAAMLWGTVGALIATRISRPLLRRLVALGFAALIVLPNAIFIEHEIDLHEVALTPVWQLANIARDYPEERHLIINPLDWLAYAQAWYPLGHEGVEVAPSYVGLRDLTEINSGVRAEFESTLFPPVQTKMDQYFYSLKADLKAQDWTGLAAQAPNYDRIWLMTYADTGIFLEEAGTLKNGPAQPPANYLANFGDRVFLKEGTYHIGGNEAIITLNWKYLGPDPEAVIFRHVFDCAGNVLGLGDGHALGRMLLFTELQPGAEIRDVRRIALEASSTEGCYAVEVGLFRSDGSRVTTLAPDGTAFENAVVTLH